MQARKSRGRKGIVGGPAGLLLAALVVCGGWLAQAAWGASPAKTPEEEAFSLGFKFFQDYQYRLAESNFSEFVAKFTNSPHRAEAILYQARARLEQSNYAGAIDLLQQSSAQAGALQTNYVFWMAEARSRTGDWPGVIGLLQQTNSPLAAADGRSELAAPGWLLLGEALLHEQRPEEGENKLASLNTNGWSQDLRWQHQYLLCRLRLAGGRKEAALSTSSNSLQLALDPRQQAASVFLQGEILEKLDRRAEALAVYATNLVDSQPADVQGQALARTIPLTVALDAVPQAIQALETLIAQHPRAQGLDLAHVSVGELYLKVYASPTNPAPGTNVPAAPDLNTITNTLGAAQSHFNIVIHDFTNSALLPKAHLDRGWCDWLSTNIREAKVDFEEAAAHLPLPPDQAVARFKLADAQFILGDYTNAARNYRLVLTNKAPEITNALFDLALYQLAEADIQIGDEEGAQAAVDKILQWYPVSYHDLGQRGLLLMGEDWNRRTNYAKARAVFTSLLEHAPHSPLAPQVQYAIARTYEQEGNWKEAINCYRQWMTNHSGATNLVPEVEFHLALARGNAGLTNQALADLTNFVANYPSNALAPWALNAVADYYYNQGDFISAERNYEKLFQNPGAGELAYQAQFWAGKSALARQGMEEAKGYFTKLLSQANVPQELVDRTYFALGDIFFQQYLDKPTRENLTPAITAISKVTNGAPTNAMAVEALGRLGDYWMQWADKHGDTDSYATVSNIYETIVGYPATAAVSVSARSQAEVGLAWVAKQQGQSDQALTHCYQVLNFDPFDPYWVERAGELAAQMCEDQQRWDQAGRVYNRVLEKVPALRPMLTKKIAAAQARREAAGK
jgi:tetratricopeptide (TPR) repeat protein